MPERIFVVRHGATEWSKNGRHTGSTDLPLAADGETEALEAGRRLAGYLGRSPALVLTSPLTRARQTCEMAGYVDAELDDLLREMDYGDYEGLTTAEVRAQRPGWDLFRDGCPNGETIEDVGRRADRVIDRLKSDGSLRGLDVALFSHGHILRVVAARWLGQAPAEARRFALGSGGIGSLGWEHEWTVLHGWNR